MKQVYISGPMRGYVDNNAKAFYRVERELRALGYDVVNPARLDEEAAVKLDWTKPADQQLGMARDLLMLLRSDGIVLLRDWQLSRGASAEAATAEWAGKFVIYQRPDMTLGPQEGLHLFTHTIGATQAEPTIKGEVRRWVR